MDSGHHTEPDYTQPRADDEMQVDTALAPESRNAEGEVEMLSPGNSPRSNSLDIADRESPATPLDDPVPQVPSSSSASQLQPSLRRTSTRRTRVEDDHDDERDRRHPSQRVGGPSHPSNSSNTAFPSSPHSTSSIPTNMGPGPSGLSSLNSRPFRFFQHMTPHHHHSNDNSASPIPHNAPQQRASVDAGASPVPESTANPTPASEANAGPAPQQPPQPGNNLRHQYLGGFAITIDVNGSTTTTPLSGIPNMNSAPNATGASSTGPTRDEQPQTQDRTHQQPQQPQQPPPPRSQPDGTPFPGVGPGAFADLLTRIGLLAALSFQNPALFERDVDDPERAKRLIEGLEDVPVGLIRRLERVGKNGHEEGGLGDGGCAVCWERLLFEADETPKEEVKTETEKEPKDKEEVKADDSDASPLESSPDSGSDVSAAATSASSSLTSLPSSTSSTSFSSTSEAEKKENPTEKKYQRVVSLPCAHVFHAACLVPWFSKPKQTTCPICRFNIDPENLTYNPGAQGRPTASEQAQTREGARGEAGETQGQGRTETGFGAGDGPTEVGIDIPLMFGGSLPFGIPMPMRGAERNNGQPAGAASTTQTGTTPANTDNTTTTTTTNNEDDDHDDTENDGDDNATAREPHDIVTIGFDMYIGRGPPPFPFRGPGVIQIPLSGPPPTTTNPADAPAAAASNDTPQAPLPTTNSNTAPTANPDTSAGNTTDANAPGAGTGQQGSEAGGRARGTTTGAGTTFAIPIPMSQGLGRALGDIFSRILGGGGPSVPGGPAPAPGPAAAAPGNSGAGAAGAGTGVHVGTGAGQNPSQGPVVFGPERPPAPAPPVPSLGLPMPLPGNVGLGLGLGGGRGQGMTPIILPFGPRGGAGAGAGAGVNEGARGQGQEQAQAGQGQGARGGQPEIVFESVPFFDIISGLFGPPPGPAPAQARGPATAEEGAGQQPPQPTQTQPPRHPQEQFHQPGGFGFTWVPGSPPSRAPSSQPQQPHQPQKKWAPPPAPGLTLRQRVEKKEKEAGLRCCDISCGVGPSDDDPWVDVPADGLKQLTIRDAIPCSDIRSEDGIKIVGSGVGLGGDVTATDGKVVGSDEMRKAVCSHTFHSSCLVSTERVALALRDAEVSFVGPEGKKEVEVSCPVCRGAGRVSKAEWDAGVEALG